MVGSRECRGGSGEGGMVGRVSVGMAADGGEERLLCVTTGVGGVCSVAWW